MIKVITEDKREFLFFNPTIHHCIKCKKIIAVSDRSKNIDLYFETKKSNLCQKCRIEMRVKQNKRKKNKLISFFLSY